MIEIFVTATFTRLYSKLPVTVQKKADKKTELFRKNPFYNSLRTKKLEPHHEQVWSFWIDKDYRITDLHPTP
jgi:mRNA-degrading endonuclease RelE of RelBE toxin-antitoxin system